MEIPLIYLCMLFSCLMCVCLLFCVLHVESNHSRVIWLQFNAQACIHMSRGTNFGLIYFENVQEQIATYAHVAMPAQADIVPSFRCHKKRHKLLTRT